MSLSIFNELNSLPNITARTYTNLVRLLSGDRIIDLLLYSPINVIDRSNTPDLLSTQTGKVVTVTAKVITHIPSLRRKTPYQIICTTSSGELTLVFFNQNKHYLEKILPTGVEKVISGKITQPATIAHPDYVVNKLSDIKNIEPVYPLTQGISNKMVINLINNVLSLLPEISEWIDEDLMRRNNWQSFRESIINLHNPHNIGSIAHSRARLACDEFLVYQLRLHKMRLQNTEQTGKAIKGDGHLRNKLRLPFTLTGGQEQVINEIIQDQELPKKMIRLLQGDVGSGKTVVALFAMLNAVECGLQVAFMVPTEILAIQHFNFLNSVIGEYTHVELLTGKVKVREKRIIELGLKGGEIKILIGTHALFQDKLEFKDLGLVVIDEQHRFGVKQRAKLLKKGNDVDLLLMSATPIPRTLSLALYGDIDCSILDEKPKKRFPIKTSIMHKKNLGTTLPRIENALREGSKIYWVCPLIEESEKIDMAAVTARFKHLSEIFPKKIGLIHGKMKIKEREKVMEKFKNSEITLLVATTVIEVGIDIQDANIIIIENAERFGLSQLHQLRGRVGRGEKESFCVLLYENASKVTCKRLTTLRDSNDGFFLAEQDLKIRGSGEIIGYKQSGVPNFKFLDLQEGDTPLAYIHKLAREIISSDPNFSKNEHIKLLMEIFNNQDDGSSFF